MTRTVYLCSHFCTSQTEYVLGTGHHQEEQDVAFTPSALLPDQRVHLQISKFSGLFPQAALAALK